MLMTWWTFYFFVCKVGLKHSHPNSLTAPDFKGLLKQQNASHQWHEPSGGNQNGSSRVSLQLWSCAVFQSGMKVAAWKLPSVCFAIPAKPSAPKCWLEGADRVGGTVSLRCKSEGGSGPLAYSWKREHPGPIPATAVQSKRDLCWRHHATTHQRECVWRRLCVFVCPFVTYFLCNPVEASHPNTDKMQVQFCESLKNHWTMY